MVKRERLTGIDTKQILLKLPSGLYEEIIRIVEKKIEEAYIKGNYRSRQEFILAAVRKSVNRERL